MPLTAAKWADIMMLVIFIQILLKNNIEFSILFFEVLNDTDSNEHEIYGITALLTILRICFYVCYRRDFLNVFFFYNVLDSMDKGTVALYHTPKTDAFVNRTCICNF